jgi:hypothetical protein
MGPVCDICTAAMSLIGLGAARAADGPMEVERQPPTRRLSMTLRVFARIDAPILAPGKTMKPR